MCMFQDIYLSILFPFSGEAGSMPLSCVSRSVCLCWRQWLMAYVRVSLSMLRHTCRNQRTTSRSQFTLPSTWVLETASESRGLQQEPVASSRTHCTFSSIYGLSVHRLHSISETGSCPIAHYSDLPALVTWAGLTGASCHTQVPSYPLFSSCWVGFLSMFCVLTPWQIANIFSFARGYPGVPAALPKKLSFLGTCYWDLFF